MGFRRSFAAASCLLAILAAGCSSGPAILEGTTWMQEQPDSEEQTASLAPEDVTITFGSGGEVTGTYTYLTYEGRYTDDGDRLTISGLRWTSSVCGMEQCLERPDAFLGTLAQAGHYEVGDGRLRLDVGERALVFIERRKP
jgi:heat shock protein HslJ